MKTQATYKHLSIPLLLTVIFATGIGDSLPAQATSLFGFQNLADAKPKAVLAANPCPKGMSPNFPPPCWRPRPNRVPEPISEREPSRDSIEKPNMIEKPTIDRPNLEKPPTTKPTVAPSPELESSEK